MEGLVKLVGEHRSTDRSVKVVDEDGHSERLLEATIALLGADDDSFPVKGVREALKRFWHVAFQNIELSRQLLDRLVAQVVNGLNASKDQDEASEEDDDEQNSDLEDHVKEESKDNDGTESESVDDDEDGVEPEDLDTSADDALADMINLRKSLRKTAALDAKRKELIMNTRYMDLLDVSTNYFASHDLNTLLSVRLCCGHVMMLLSFFRS